MLESTWQEDAENRPSFSDIIHKFSDGGEDISVNSGDVTVERTTSEPNGYIDVKLS